MDESKLPEGWEVKKLGDVCDIKPQKKRAKEKLADHDLVSFFPMADLHEFNHCISPKQEKQLKDVYKGYVYFEDNDVLLAKITPCFENGKLGIAKNLKNGIGFGSSEYMVFRPKDDITSEYIYYFLSLDNIRKTGKNRMTGAVGHKRIPVEYVSNQLLLIPPLPEQMRIVSILDKVFAEIEKAKSNAQQNLKNAKELFESYLQGVFGTSTSSATGREGWEEKIMGEVYDVRDGTHDSPKYQEKGYPLITSKNLKNGKITYDKVKYISKLDYSNINKRSKVNVNDILFAMIGTIGNAVVIKNEPDYAIKNVALFKINNMQNSQFLKFYLDSKFVIDKMKREAKGTTQKFVGLGYLRNFKIHLPPIEEQKRLVQKLDVLFAETKKMEAVYKQKIADLEELKKSVLQKAFRGEL